MKSITIAGSSINVNKLFCTKNKLAFGNSSSIEAGNNKRCFMGGFSLSCRLTQPLCARRIHTFITSPTAIILVSRFDPP